MQCSKPQDAAPGFADMKTFAQWLRWVSPWVALGLAAALLYTWLRPAPAPEGQPPPAASVEPGTPGSPPAAEGSPAPPATGAPERAAAADAPPVSYAGAVDRSAPAVVNVYTERVVRVPRVGNLPPDIAQLFGDLWTDYRERVDRSLGSGVVVDRQGHVVTNYHVVSRATQISVQLRDRREAPARLVGIDPDTDLAVLAIELPDLPVMPLGRSDRLRVGDPVLAIGNPLGLGQTVTSGIVSATGRGRLGVSTFENFIQTDAAINFGNSGGALVNAAGELVGINTAVIARNAGIEGIGFAIPVDLVRGVVEAILRDGRVIRGWIGIRPQSLKPEEARQFGFPEGSVVVTAVYRGGPADAEGIQPGDVITQVDGESLAGAEDLLARIAALKPGQAARVTLRRGPPFEGPPRELTVRVGVVERPARAAATS
jgi:serine protease DegS